jgi:hypothetical protein
VVEIFPQSSHGRDSPPGCLCSSEMPGTALGCEHIIARELGGCDDGKNIVLQYGEWLGKANGDWRKVEIVLFDADPLTRNGQQVMVLAIDYPVAPMLDQGMLVRLANRERQVYLVDPPIPNRFKVWWLVKSWPSATISVMGFFTAADRSRMFEALFKALLGVLALVEATVTGCQRTTAPT